jgi:hypothetical protein
MMANIRESLIRCIESPYVQRLHSVKESNPYHNEVLVFEHTMNVVDAIPKSIDLFVSLEPASEIHFSSLVGDFSRSDLLHSFSDIKGSDTSVHSEPFFRSGIGLISNQDYIIKLFRDNYATDN